MSVVARTLAGSPDGAQHLVEHTLGAADLALAPLAPAAPGENFLLLLGLSGAAARARSLDQAWPLAPDELLWLRTPAPVHLRAAAPAAATHAGAVARPATLLAWRFTAAALPPEVAELALALPPGARPLLGPRPLSSAETGLVLGLRSCPVAPALRSFWAAAKLLELVTHLLPPPTSPAVPDSASVSDDSLPAAPAPADSAPLPAPVLAALACMEARLAESIGLAELAAAAGQSPAHFSRVFSEALGHGPTAHLRRLRMERAARLLAAGRANVTEAALAVGYQSLGQFSRVFAEHHGRPPSAFLPRNNG